MFLPILTLVLKIVHDYNTLGGDVKVDQHLTDFPVPRKGAGGAKNMNFRKSIELNKPNVQLPGPLRPSVSLLRLTGRHFPEHIPSMDKKFTPTRQCFICCCKTDEQGKRIRHETRIYCKKCNI